MLFQQNIIIIIITTLAFTFIINQPLHITKMTLYVNKSNIVITEKVYVKTKKRQIKCFGVN